MVIFTLIFEAFAALWANKLRTFLTILGIVMGVTSVIAIVSTVEGMQTNMENIFRSLGPNSFMVTRFGVGLSMNEYLERLRRKKLTRELIEPIKEGCPDCAEVGAEGYASDHIKYGSQRMRWVQIEGQTPNVLAIQAFDLESGRHISWEDDYRRQQVVVLGHSVKDKLFPEVDPIGKRVKIGKREFMVVGVMAERGNIFGEDLDEFMVIPLSTLQKIYRQPGNPVNLIIGAASLERREFAMEQVRTVLRAARELAFSDNDDFTILTPDAILGFINDVTRAFRVLLVSLPLLSIVVGGIVIMNIMMISVTERTREIGIRKSIGANRRHILLQFMYESLILSLVGGILGIVFGIYLGSKILVGLLDIHLTPTTLAVILGFGISTAVGLFFGIYPATKAAKLDPIKALAYE
jgi:putative ABC transport system permease protein